MNKKLTDFVILKIAEVENHIKAREQMRDAFLGGTDESWAAAAKLHPTTASLPEMKKAERLRAAASQSRILEKLEYELAMFNEIFKLLHSTKG